jgi:hypothetical protein
MGGPEPGPVCMGDSPEFQDLLRRLGLEHLFLDGGSPAPEDNVSVPAEEQACPLPSLDELTWSKTYVTRLELLGLMKADTRLSHGAWLQAVKEIEAGGALAKEWGARAGETILDLPPILSGKFSQDNAEAKAWVDARANELRWQAFEEVARKDAFPDYKEGPGMTNKIIDRTREQHYRETTEQLKDGFLGPGAQKVDTPSGPRYVSADGEREVRLGNDGTRDTMTFLKRDGDSVDATEVWLN